MQSVILESSPRVPPHAYPNGKQRHLGDRALAFRGPTRRCGLISRGGAGIVWTNASAVAGSLLSRS